MCFLIRVLLCLAASIQYWHKVYRLVADNRYELTDSTDLATKLTAIHTCTKITIIYTHI